MKVELDVAKQGLVGRGARVTVTLPDGRTVAGVVAQVGRVARRKGDQGSGGSRAGGGGSPGGDGGSSSGSGSKPDLVIDVVVTLRSHRGSSGLDEAPVTVGIARETKRHVLAVPVTALLARPGGGYGVEVVENGRRRLVAVATGLFAGGYVEISGRGVAEGARVAVPDAA